MKLKEILDKTTAFFKEKKIETARLDAELLLSYGLGLERIQLYLKFDQPMSEEELVKLRELVRRRAQGEPVAYILGYRDFYRSRFKVSPAVLIPRPETEHAVEAALEWAKPYRDHNLNILDLGTGSGCLGLSVLKELPNAKLVAVDISTTALQIAKVNSEELGLSDRVLFLNVDAVNSEAIMKALKQFTDQERVDIFLSNPPYIAEGDTRVQSSVEKFEPHFALYAVDNGLDFLRRWSQAYSHFLNTKSILLMEMGLEQGSAMREHLEGLKNFDEISVISDLSGHDRVICGVKNG